MKNRNKKGFTLIELLIVIAILGILAGIVMVSLNSAKNKAKFASWKTSAVSANPAAITCSDEATVIDGNENEPICSDTNVTSAVWPDIPTGVCASTVFFDATDAVTGDGSYSYQADCTIGTVTKRVTCSEAGCSETTVSE